jgi:hypothetical protein
MSGNTPISRTVPAALAFEAQPAAAPVRTASRIDALDWTKGALVVCMVVYHSINYSAFRPMAFKYLAFLPSSFILIAGFLVGQVYAAKYNLETWRPYLRLAVRGVKLLLLFLVLNVGYCMVRQRGVIDGLWEFADRAGTIFLSGNGREGIFEVLLPIAYFLLLAPVLLWVRARAGAAIAICAGGMFLLCVLLERNGLSYKNLSFLSAGLLGMACGLIPIGSIDRLARKWIAVLALYAAYRLCSYRIGELYWVEMFGALSSLILLYSCGLYLDCASAAGRAVVLLGKYSLLGYLVQIPVIQLIVHFIGGKPAHWIGVVAVIVATTGLLFLIVRGVHELRRRFRFADGTYKAVFA